MTELLQSTAQTVVGRGYLASDHISTATGLDPAITISKNGGNFANPAAGASVMTEIELTGWYKFALGTGDTDTLGPLIIRGTHATMDNIEVVFQVVAVSVAQTGDSYARLGAPAGASVSADIAAVPTDIENADALLKRDWSGMTGEAARSVLNALRFVRNKWSISAGTLTVTKEDDSTSAWTATVTGTEGANPITTVDPA